jgi:hypothetical protein
MASLRKPDILTQLAEILDEVVGEAVVIIDHQQHDWGRKLEKFKQLGSANLSSSAPEPKTENSIPSVPESETKVCKAPVAFVAAFVRLLVDIAKRATEKTEPFNVDEMPGQREDLKELSSKFGLFPDCAQSTFNTYIKGLCKFLPGHKNTTFYRDLFPEKFKSP